MNPSYLEVVGAFLALAGFAFGLYQYTIAQKWKKPSTRPGYFSGYRRIRSLVSAAKFSTGPVASCHCLSDSVSTQRS